MGTSRSWRDDLDRIVICRADALGDVVLALPVSVEAKRLFPNSKIVFYCQEYAAPIPRLCPSIDEVVTTDQVPCTADGLKQLNADCFIHLFAKKHIAQAAFEAGIPNRLGTWSRWFNWRTCNRPVYARRSRSKLHEAQLNLRIASPLGLKKSYEISELSAMKLIQVPKPLPQIAEQLDPARIKLIVHPGSRQSAPEWGVENFRNFIGRIPKEKFQIIVTGTEIDRSRVQPLLQEFPWITDFSEKLNVEQTINLISQADIHLSNSTGPMHIASVCGVRTIGLFSESIAVAPSRWMPLGRHVDVLVSDTKCEDCEGTKGCQCVQKITPESVLNVVMKQIPQILR